MGHRLSHLHVLDRGTVRLIQHWLLFAKLGVGLSIGGALLPPTLKRLGWEGPSENHPWLAFLRLIVPMALDGGSHLSGAGQADSMTPTYQFRPTHSGVLDTLFILVSLNHHPKLRELE